MYVAAKGGEKAIQQAEQLYHDLKGPLTPGLVKAVESGLPYLVDRVMGEASLYAPELAALAIAQTGGDTYEAVLILRAYRSTQPRLAYARPVDTDAMTVIRRISAAFKDIPGGQVLGPTLDYSHRLLRLDVLDGTRLTDGDGCERLKPAETPGPGRYQAVADWQRLQGMLPPLPEQQQADPAELPDLTREPLLFPSSRSHRLQALARADTGGVLALGYANMRGYGPIHPTVNEVRLAYAKVHLKHPVSGVEFSIGSIRVSQAEVVQTTKGASAAPGLELGFCATFGWNEIKTIAGSMLDMAMDRDSTHPALTEEFVLYHTEPVEASGFCIHFKLPHYVTFASGMDAMRDAMQGIGVAQIPASARALSKVDEQPAAEPGKASRYREKDPMAVSETGAEK